jgi:hypothetical protein
VKLVQRKAYAVVASHRSQDQITAAQDREKVSYGL